MKSFLSLMLNSGNGEYYDVLAKPSRRFKIDGNWINVLRGTVASGKSHHFPFFCDRSDLLCFDIEPLFVYLHDNDQELKLFRDQLVTAHSPSPS